MEINYPARITLQEGGGFLVQFVDLPDTFTEGQTLEEALFNAAEVLSAMVGWIWIKAATSPRPRPACPMRTTSRRMLKRKLYCCCATLEATARWPIWPVRWRRVGRKPSGWKTRTTGRA